MQHTHRSKTRGPHRPQTRGSRLFGGTFREADSHNVSRSQVACCRQLQHANVRAARRRACRRRGRADAERHLSNGVLAAKMMLDPKIVLGRKGMGSWGCRSMSPIQPSSDSTILSPQLLWVNTPFCQHYFSPHCLRRPMPHPPPIIN